MNKYVDIAKKNIWSIICGVIAIAGVIALLFPISSMFAELKARTEKEKSSFTAMKGVLDKDRHLPVVSIDGGTQGEPLKFFPTKEVAEVGASLVEKIKTQAHDMLAAAVQINQHTQLVPNALPNGSPEPAGTFRRLYYEVFDFWDDDKKPKSFPYVIMKAGFPPDEATITAAKKKVTDDINAKKAYAGNTVLNQPQIDAELAEALPKVADDLKQAAANNCQVYVDPKAFHMYEGFGTLSPGQFPTPGMLFNAQAGLWIQQDICQSIAEANNGSKDVTTSAVKHLIKIDLADELYRQIAAQPGGDPSAAPPAASADPSQPLTPNFALSLTGRSSNGLYDVIPFNVKIDVDITQLPKVLRALSQKKFISVLNCNVSSVDVALMKSNGYYYGDNPVVTLDLQCEELLLRDWTVPLMPLNIKQAMGIQPAPATPAPAG